MELKGHRDGAVRSLSFSFDDRLLASAGDDGSVRIWELRQRTPTVCRGHKDRVWSVRFCPRAVRGHQVLASGGEDGWIRLWSSDGGAELYKTESDHQKIWSLAFSPDGRQLASGGSDRTIRRWSVSINWFLPSRAQLRPSDPPLRGHEDWVRALAFSPDGKSLASAGHDGTVRLWNVETGVVRVLPILRPYEEADLRGALGLSDAQRILLRRLGALTD
jgi:WD40 repeat protein